MLSGHVKANTILAVRLLKIPTVDACQAGNMKRLIDVVFSLLALIVFLR
jgi:lipopolysaccharide/colanic/teichoic acid biosynthesis glycosyltransferase